MRSSVKISMVLFLVLLLSSFVSAYTPRTGVLSPEEVDFGGKTVTVIVRDIDWVVFNGGKPTDERIAEAEELFNVKIAVSSFDSVENLMSRIMANDSTYDIFRFNHRSGYFPLVSAGMLYPVSQLLPEEYFEELPTPDLYTINPYFARVPHNS